VCSRQFRSSVADEIKGRAFSVPVAGSSRSGVLRCQDALRDVTRLFAPDSIAVIGASERHPHIITNLCDRGVPVFLVNPAHREVMGRTCYPGLETVPAVPDLAVLAVNHEFLLDAAEQAARLGVKAVLVPGAGAESGARAGQLRAELARLSLEHELPLLGPNCMGYVRPAGSSPWLGCMATRVRPGGVSVISQSGSAADGVLASGGRVGLRLVVSCGAEAGRDSADILGYLAQDPATTVIGLFLEEIRRPPAFAAALEACADRGKPVICLKVGTSPAAATAAVAHTGAITGSARTYSAFLRAYGVVEVDDLPELMETLVVFDAPRRPAGRRIAAVSESGGEAELLADRASAAELDVAPLPAELAAQLTAEFPNYVHPVNPVDAWAIDDFTRVFPRTFELLVSSGAYDIIVAQVDLSQFRGQDESAWCRFVVDSLIEVCAGRAIAPAVVSSVVNDPPDAIAASALAGGLPLLRGAGPAMRALGRAANWRPRRPSSHRPPSGRALDLSDLLRPGVLAEHESARVLERYGVPFAARRRARTPDEAATAARELGFPVVVKLDGVNHKSVLGGVLLGIVDADGARSAAESLGGRVLVARQMPAGIELLCGLQRDRQFGPVLAIGLGGAVAEAAAELRTALAPVDAEEALRLVESVSPLRTSPQRQRVAEVLTALSRLAIDHPAIDAVDINPLIVSPAGVVAVDALVSVAAGHHPAPQPEAEAACCPRAVAAS
jgi:acetate---CoA ligase (ADP-forming)